MLSIIQNKISIYHRVFQPVMFRNLDHPFTQRVGWIIVHGRKGEDCN